jgi:integrase
MSEDIKVTVNQIGVGRPLALRWTDPISGKKKLKSTGTTDWRDAERQAGELEKELRAGRGTSPSKITWAEFRERCDVEKLASMSKAARNTTLTAFRTVERVLNPDRLCKLTPAAMSRFITTLRKERMRETTLGTNLRHLRAALSWAVDQELLMAVPKMKIPKAGKAKGRPITAEEFDRMIAAVPKLRPDDKDAWISLLNGLWLSGLRLGEALRLSWEDDAPFAIDLTGRRPRFRIYGEAQKSGKDETLPMTPDFATFLLATPAAERHGLVFPLNGPAAVGLDWASRMIGRIGEKAGVVVATTEKIRKRKVSRRRIQDDGKTAWLICWDGDAGEPETMIVHGKAKEAEKACRSKRDGKRIALKIRKFASAHDLRRSFGTRWAKREMPAVLQKLMRHADISTTMNFYVGLNSDEVADDLWARWDENAGNGSPPCSALPQVAPGQEASRS